MLWCPFPRCEPVYCARPLLYSLASVFMLKKLCLDLVLILFLLTVFTAMNVTKSE